ncbi:hypothetical protein LG201_01285 [Methylobacillus gramineus]|uniref:hypothetical protein n=1 Tax=Methylobacillus gramineus TaxID=755169 RepID=UPI001CFF60A4|nr:hypothetical protein [Methylobacillus gramineus]MCB5183833.1 hypothetical protein [Methylobacillus gramineus]
MLPPSFNWSPPWRDELRVLLQPHKLTLLRLKGGIKHTLVAIDEIALAATDNSNLSKATNPTFWQPAVTSLNKILKESRWRGCNPKVVVSNHFANYSIIPWNAGLTSQQEQQAFVRHCFLQAYGEFSRKWDVRTSPAAYGSPTLASAIDDQLLQALRQEFRQAGMPLRNIHPHLMMAMNVVRQQFGRKPLPPSLCLVMLEHGRLLIALIENGKWLSLQSYAAESDLELQLEALIEREAIIAGTDASSWPVFIYWPEPNIEVTLQGRKVRNIFSLATSTPLHSARVNMEAWS